MDGKEIRILLVEDDQEDAFLLEDYLAEAERTRLKMTHVERLEDALNRLDQERFDIVLLDISLPDEQGIRTFERAQERAANVPIIVLTGLDDQMLALRAVRGGAQDYLLKHQIDTPLLERSIRYAIERKQAEEALRQRETYFRSLIENTLDIITLLDIDGTVIYESPSIERVLGYGQDELVGQNVFEYVHADDLPGVLEVFRRGIQLPGSLQSAIFRFRHKHGSWRILEAMGKNLLDDPVVRSVVISSRDITERRRMEEALRESEERLRTVVANAPIVLFAIDREGKVKLLEGKGLDTLGFRSEEAIGRSIFELSDALPQVVTYINQALGGETVSSLLTVQNVAFECWFTPLRGEKGEVVSVMGVATDVTDLKRSERELKRSRKQLRDLTARLQSIREEERKHISREIHDELGQALTILKLDVSWIARRLTREQEELRNKASMMKDMIDATIQTVRRISTELRPGLLDDLGLTAAIEWQVQEFQSRTGIECAFLSQPVEVQLDQERATAVFRIFQEILTNVARHARASKVEINLQRRDGHLVLVVADDGRGMNRSKMTGSKSLGLVGMRERALAIGGDIKFQSKRGKGTVVTVRIPVDAAEGGAS